MQSTAAIGGRAGVPPVARGNLKEPSVPSVDHEYDPIPSLFDKETLDPPTDEACVEDLLAKYQEIMGVTEAPPPKRDWLLAAGLVFGLFWSIFG